MKKKKQRTSFTLAYDSDIQQAYAFYCARYDNISYSKFLNLGIREFQMKLGSIPENEPLYKIIKSRVIDISKIKDKEERKYWSELKRVNRIPDIYLSDEEVNNNIKDYLRTNGGLKNGNKHK